ncbi:MAG: triose-phosphate isomerase [Sedimentisphaerales bacterium]|jgi:triosephosphate isomerase|nr:triose-phosphate isomerase [Sedimentisphaerales bacterium]HNY79634.1 triose-phosphate isomerase [Sedimentisphaerales bacterium]HOC62602.1 triose-phosphate isomerase [Sedimentisphaerales bacterium]HOH65310.1 triose-phosphate isomerase [Sedimentisphaerales bacterium]HPY49777.1 triose-phosphate isomerase [Sedimentisphaerales bacterium]
MRKPFVAGNWKMNTDSHSGVALAKAVVEGSSGLAGSSVDVAVIPPFVYLPAVGAAVSSSGVALGAQDVYFEAKGAFTGEISAAMLKDVGCTYVLCGHSERRHVLGESDELINKKVAASISGGLLPILCVGELLAERDASQTEQVVERQTRAGLAGLSAEKTGAVTIAYEPVWAIGTGRTATREQAQEVHAFIRKLLARMYDKSVAQDMRILYGGSVKADNAEELMGQPDVDGCLVGGASLKADDFVQIIEAAA